MKNEEGAKRGKDPLPWTAADERRLRQLVDAVVKTAPEVGGETVKDCVLAAVGLATVQELAERVDVPRSVLSRMLAGKEPKYEARRAVEKYLMVPPGGLERVFAAYEWAA